METIGYAIRLTATISTAGRDRHRVYYATTGYSAQRRGYPVGRAQGLDNAKLYTREGDARNAADRLGHPYTVDVVEVLVDGMGDRVLGTGGRTPTTVKVELTLDEVHALIAAANRGDLDHENPELDAAAAKLFDVITGGEGR